MKIKEKIETLKKMGWSYRRLARYFNVSQTTIMRWHKGIHKPEHYITINAQLQYLINAWKTNKIPKFKLGQKVKVILTDMIGYIGKIERRRDNVVYYVKFNKGNLIQVYFRYEEKELEAVDELTDDSKEKVQKAVKELNQTEFVKCEYCGKKSYTTHEYYNHKCIDKEIAECEKKLQHLKEVKANQTWGFTEDEKVILRNLDKKYNWILREDNCLFIFEGCPTKYELAWDDLDSSGVELGGLNHLFKCIKENEGPCEFREFI